MSFVFLRANFGETELRHGNVGMKEMLQRSDWRELYELSEAAQAGLDFAAWQEALAAAAEKFLPPDAGRAQQFAFYRQLHLKDFSLAQACSRGNAGAWQQFLERFQNGLYRAAVVLTKDAWAAKDLSDSLIADLFVKLASYSGRGSLEGWLKALLTHAYIDHHRSRQRTVSLENRVDLLRTLCADQTSNPEFDSRLNTAIKEILSQRSPEERFLLTAYFFDSWTLAEIATTLGVHESSISRRINRTVKEIRKSLNRHLQKTGMSARQIEESFTSGTLELALDLRELLLRGLVRE